jgi:myo-inositol-1-phosphate synthase
MSKVRLGIVGVGNCASALVQGITFYKDVEPGEPVPGLMHTQLGPYGVSDIEVVAAFDVDGKKVGRDVSEAIFSEPNNTIRFAEDVAPTGAVVQRGPTLDGLGSFYREEILESDEIPVDVAQALREAEVDVLVSYLPVGSEDAARHYAAAAIEAGCAFVNCMPAFIASDKVWAQRFSDAGVPIVGDDIKSQLGATIVHRVLAKLFEDRGVTLDHTSQLNFGGNMDFKNMLERERLKSKKISKTQAVTSQLRDGIEPENIHIGPSDYVPWLNDRKWAHIRLEGREFGNVPMSVELKLEVWDSPNSGGVVIDAVRCAKLAMDRGMAGPLIAPSAYFMKSPPVQFSDDQAREMVAEFIRGNGRVAEQDWARFIESFQVRTSS